jgi:antitoxin HicB
MPNVRNRTLIPCSARADQLLDKVEAVAVKRVIACQIERAKQRRKLTKTALASQMKTSRAALERLLDPSNTSIPLSTQERAALALETVSKMVR